MTYSLNQLIELSKKDINHLKDISLSFDKENNAFNDFLLHIFQTNHLDLINFYFNNKILSEQELLLTSAFITSSLREELFIDLVNNNKINKENFTNHCISTFNFSLLDKICISCKNNFNFTSFNDSQLNSLIENSKNNLPFRETFVLNHLSLEQKINTLINLQKNFFKNENDLKNLKNHNFSYNQYFILKDILNYSLNEKEKQLFDTFVDLTIIENYYEKNKFLIEQIKFLNYNFNKNKSNIEIKRKL